MPESSPKRKKRQAVLDSWAVIALIDHEEPAYGRVRELMDAAKGSKENMGLAMSWINLGEVYYILARRLGENGARKAVQLLLTVPVRAYEPTRARVMEAASIKARSRVSYADAFAMGLAKELGTKLVTGDKEIRDAASSEALAIDWLGA